MKNMRGKFFTILLFLTLSLTVDCLAQNPGEIDFFNKRDFGRYFISDMYSPNPSSHLGAGMLRSGYNINPDRNSNFTIYSETVLGTEIPIMIWNIGGDRLNKIAFSIPVSVNFLLDISEPITHPMINTDYRLGALEINYLHSIGMGFLKNASLKVIPFYHESSHLGDELTVYRMEEGFPITRVNATSNTAEVSLTVNDENAESGPNHSFKIGSSILWNKSTGYYRMRPEEGDTSKITPSDNRFIWYAHYQFHSPTQLMKNPNLSTVLSLELRNRVRYNYPFYIYDPSSSKPPEEVKSDRKFIPSLNGYMGWRYRIKKDKAGYIGLYFRLYYGLNPYGQFRNIPVHRFYSLSLVYES